jgi:hypothetical protein
MARAAVALLMILLAAVRGGQDQDRHRVGERGRAQLGGGPGRCSGGRTERLQPVSVRGT